MISLIIFILVQTKDIHLCTSYPQFIRCFAQNQPGKKRKKSFGVSFLAQKTPINNRYVILFMSPLSSSKSPHPRFPNKTSRNRSRIEDAQAIVKLVTVQPTVSSVQR